MTNNEAERAWRHWVILRKLSWGTRTEVGSHVVALLASVIDTWRQRGHSPRRYLERAIYLGLTHEIGSSPAHFTWATHLERIPPVNVYPADLSASTSEPRERQAFDPFSDLLLAQRTRPDHLAPIDLGALTPFQRALLAIDGTVTKFIEAYTLEPVDVIRLRQESQALEAEQFWLEATQGTPVIARQVLLRGRHSATVYLYAISLFVPARLPEAFTAGLAVEEGGLGRILLNSQIENRREILWYGRESGYGLPDDIRTVLGLGLISRTYRIIAAGRPAMLINEKFPARCPVQGSTHQCLS